MYIFFIIFLVSNHTQKKIGKFVLSTTKNIFQTVIRNSSYTNKSCIKLNILDYFCKQISFKDVSLVMVISNVLSLVAAFDVCWTVVIYYFLIVYSKLRRRFWLVTSGYSSFVHKVSARLTVTAEFYYYIHKWKFSLWCRHHLFSAKEVCYCKNNGFFDNSVSVLFIFAARRAIK